ncbi:polymer-forming cytoskeletal protein [Samsonia erythrinae]|nr:polymer-forming cytoskeletal protein [Samsonia erythrinae]
MRNYNLLWGVWAIWALLVIVWLLDVYYDFPLRHYGLVVVAVSGVSAALAFFYTVKRKNTMFSFDKNKKGVKKPQGRSDINSSSDISPSNELINSVNPVRVKKDTFISQGARMAGSLAVDGNITVEGQVEGDIQCDDTIKVEHTGQINGEMKSQQIIINGRVEGRVVASVVAILAQGKVFGDIFSDELSIEKGGIFTGQSHPLTPPAQGQEMLSYVEKKKAKVGNALNAQEKPVTLASSASTA